MPDHLYISSSCRIDNHHVFKNGNLLLEGTTGGTDWLLIAYRHFAFDYPRFYRMDNLCKLGWLAAEILLQDGSTSSYRPEDVGLVIANKSSSLDTDLKYFESSKAIASPALFVYTLPNIVMGEISIRHQLKGESALFLSDQFDAGFIQRYVQELFTGDAVKICICGWLEFFGNDIEVALYLVEKSSITTAIPFTEENINKLYQLSNG